MAMMMVFYNVVKKKKNESKVFDPISIATECSLHTQITYNIFIHTYR